MTRTSSIISPRPLWLGRHVSFSCADPKLEEPVDESQVLVNDSLELSDLSEANFYDRPCISPLVTLSPEAGPNAPLPHCICVEEYQEELRLDLPYARPASI